MVDIQQLSKSYRQSPADRKILDNLSLTLEPAKYHAIIGRSGSGKSTLLNLIAGLDRPDGGNIAIDHTSMNTLSEDKLAQFRLQHIGIVFQFFNFLPTLTLLQNVAIPALLLGLSRQKADLLAREEMQQLDIGELHNRYPHEVSGGEIQRAAIARALINTPKLLLADEPTGNLDSANTEHILSLLRSIVTTRQTTLIVVTHDNEVVRMADKVYRLVEGRIVSE